MKHEDVRATRRLISAAVDLNAGFEATAGDEYQLEVLLDFHREVRYCQRFSPLVLIALSKSSVQHAIALLDAGACPDALQPDHMPPLLPALDFHNLELVRCLVAAGASINVYHPRVIGNMSLIVCLYFLRGLNFMLRCGAETESLFGRRPLLGSAESNSSESVDESTDEHERETPTTPIPFWRIVARNQDLMQPRGVTLGQVLRHLLQFTASVRLDERLADFVNSSREWLHIRATAGGTSLYTLNWFSQF